MRRVLVLIYALIFVDEVALLGIVPVLPVYTDHLGLTKSQAGLLLSAASLSIVIVSIPAGRLADRVGARRMTIAAGTLIIVSMLLQGAATGFASLMAARLLFGCASGTLWAAGVSWLTDTAPAHRRASTLGAVVPVAGVGGMLGPLYTGVVTHHASARVAFVGIAVAAAAVTAALLLTPDAPPVRHAQHSLVRAVRVAWRDHWIAAGIVIVLLGGLADGMINLLAPLELTAEGFTSAATGLVLSIAAGLFIVSSAIVTHRPRRLVSARAAGVAVLLQAASLGLVLAHIAAGTVVSMVLVRSLFAGWAYTIAFPLSASGARRTGLGTGTLNGLLGLAWGAANFVGPPLAGTLAEKAGDQVAYLVLAVMLVGSGLWLLRPRGATADEAEPAPTAVL